MSAERLEDLRDAFRGSLLGAAVGDALGRPVKGWIAARIARERGEVRDMVGHPRGVPVFLAGSALVGGILLAVGVWIAYGGGSVSDLLTALRGGGAAPLPAPTASAGAGAPRVEPTVSLAPARPTPVPNAGSVVRREPVPHPDPRGRRSTSGDEGWGPIHRDESEQIE